MTKFFLSFFAAILLLVSQSSLAQTDSIVLRDINWDTQSPAGMKELFIPSGDGLLAGFIYKANGPQKHPTLLLLHGYPGNERNLDLAQVVRAHGWNVIFFDYRGSWGSKGQFSFMNCVEDVVHVVDYCKKNQDSLQIDTANIALFGHSMGGWICLKAIQQLPGIKKGFALSTWDIYHYPNAPGQYFVLNATHEQIFGPVSKNPDYFNLAHDPSLYANKQIVMLDEHTRNKSLAEALRSTCAPNFDYEVWPTDHPFTNKRVALMKKVLEFLDKGVSILQTNKI